MSYIGDWSPGPLEDQLGLIAVRVGAWNHFGYADPQEGQAGIPPLGERSADAITAAHGALKAIDQLARQLTILRSRLRVEIDVDERARAARVDAMLARQDETGGAQ